MAVGGVSVTALVTVAGPDPSARRVGHPDRVRDVTRSAGGVDAVGGQATPELFTTSSTCSSDRFHLTP